MAEVLSQSQIDELLNSMKSGEPSPVAEEKKEDSRRNYRLYDFYSPRKFTKDRLRLLKGIYDNFARIATSQINSLFRVNSEVSVLSIEEQRYYEFSNALHDSDVLTLVNVKLPDESKYPPMLMHVSPLLMVNMIDRMLGSVVFDVNIDTGYTYTELEMPLYEKIMQYLLMITRDAWNSYIKMQFSLERIEENPSLFQDISVDETVVIVVLNLSMQDLNGQISVCVPGNLLFGIFEIIDRRKHTEDEYENLQAGASEEIMMKLRASTFQMKAQLGEAEIDLSDIYGLKVGDVINLNKPKDSEVSLFVEGQPWFVGKLGVHKKNMAVRINRRITDEERAEMEKGASDEKLTAEAESPAV